MTPDSPKHLDQQLLNDALGAGALSERPHLFSDSAISLPSAELAQLTAFVATVSRLVDTPAYQTLIAARSGLDAGILAQQPPGVCLGFDFHRAPDGPKLIEINTNAGGALLVTLLNRAWGLATMADAAESQCLQMFRQEWMRWQGAGASAGSADVRSLTS